MITRAGRCNGRKKVGEKFGRVKKNAYLCTVDENARMLSEYVGEGAMPINIIRYKRKTLRDNKDSGSREKVGILIF